MSIASGEYTARYFTKTRAALMQAGMEDVVTMQVFQKDQSVLAGITEAIEIIKIHSGNFGERLKILALPNGSLISPKEVVMTIEGPLVDFVHLESVYLGVLARSTRVATNMRRVVKAAGGKPVLFMGDRFDRYENQESDGEAALIGGAAGICTPAMGRRTDSPAQGTMPHALIAACGGDIVKACQVMHNAYPDEPVSALVDFNNDCVGDSLRCLEAFGKDLASVRLDTSENMVDKSINIWEAVAGLAFDDNVAQNKATNGVNPTLVRNVRKALDEHGGQHVKIVVSGGFTPEKIARFELWRVPVDMYGVGSSIIKNGPDFTADVVKPVAKQGRQYWPNPRLVEV